MARVVDEWVGKDDDTPVPDRVRVRVFDRKAGRCHRCTRKVLTGERWTCEHLIALINWRATDDQPHGNRESNLDVTCCNCLPLKNAEDQAEKSEVYQGRKAHILHSEDLGRGSSWRRPITPAQAPDRCRGCGHEQELCICPPREKRPAFQRAR
jgi:5-methylcytosine-specific restriction protein A